MVNAKWISQKRALTQKYVKHHRVLCSIGWDIPAQDGKWRS